VRRLAWSTTVVTGAMAATSVAFAFAFADDGTRLPPGEGATVSAPAQLMFGVMVVAFAALGTLLASRLPRNAIGWLLCVASLALALSGLADGWYVHAFYADPGSPLPPVGLLWVANWIWVFGFTPLITALLLLFPDGHLPSRRWWPAGALVAAAMLCLFAGYAFEPGALEDYRRVENPLGVDGGLPHALRTVGFPLMAGAAIASAAALVVRYRRSGGVERQQLKWMAAAAALVVAAWLLNALLDQVFGVQSSYALPLVLLALPGAATVAILRYRLYDLGRIVNRTLVYLALTVTLGAVYLGLVLVIGLTLGTSNVAIAVSTLAVAALFRPLRSRIQAAVDRRFYRRRYDAARTLQHFGSRLRDQLDLDAVQGELVGVVHQTVQPEHVTLWLPRNDSRTHGP
jgi:hypothetical protein